MANLIPSVDALKKMARCMLALKRIAIALKMPAGCTPDEVAAAVIHALGLAVMADNLGKLIETAAELAAAKEFPNDDFALFRHGASGWEAHMVNSCPSVRLGEIEGDFVTHGATAVAAVEALILKMKQSND